MAETILLVPNKQSGHTLLSSYRLKHGLADTTEGQVVKKVQVGAAPGDYSFVIASAPPLYRAKMGKGSIQRFLQQDFSRFFHSPGAAANYKTGLSNAQATIHEASRLYTKGQSGFVTVSGLVYTKWQAFLKTKAPRVRTVNTSRGYAPAPEQALR